MESPQEVKLRYVDYDMPNLNSVLTGLFDQIEFIPTAEPKAMQLNS